MAENIRIVFRYRNLVAETVSEHLKLIEKFGYCWWGWWKKPREDARQSVWDEIECAVEENRETTIGLFDSGSGEVFTAALAAVLRPADVHANSVPQLEKGEKEKVPDYYADSPFSRAWLKLTSVSTTPLAFFKKYAFSAPPPLPGVAARYLDRLTGKLVIDADELRAMDTTIWRVEQAKADASDERFLAPGLRVYEPVSTTPLPLTGNKILHITDLHYDKRPPSETGHYWGHSTRKDLAIEIGRAVTSMARDIGLVVVTGDLTFIGAEEEFDQARHGMNSLMGTLGLGGDEVVVCPGNHDIRWAKDPGETYDRAVEPDAAPDEATAAYRKFYRDLLGHEPNRDLSMGRRYVLPCGMVVDICALNSSSLATGKGYLAGMGRVGDTVFDEVQQQLGWEAYPNSPSLRVVALHHHVTQAEDVEDPDEYKTGFGLAIDAKRTLREAARSGVQLVMHGHRHRAFFWREGVYELPENMSALHNLGMVSVLGGGSAGAAALPDTKNTFNVITVESDRVVVQLYQSKNGSAFKPITTWSAPLSLIEGRLTLGDWSPAGDGA